MISACSNPVFVLWLFILGGAFLNIWLSEDNWMHGARDRGDRPVHPHVLCAVGDQTRTTLEAAIGLTVLAVWETLLIGAYWWLWRQRE